jgi:hypothetical protein
MLYINVIVTMSPVAQNILPLFQNRFLQFKIFHFSLYTFKIVLKRSLS